MVPPQAIFMRNSQLPINSTILADVSRFEVALSLECRAAQNQEHWFGERPGGCHGI
jgi:hypothetical protein